MADNQAIKALSRLYRIAEAGERGYATASTNATNQGVKLFMKAHARQRANFLEEIDAELRRLGGSINPGHSILGTIHRGRVAIFSAMTIENDKRERTVLREAALGERFALRAYEEALRAERAPETREMVQRQHALVQKAAGQIRRMLGADGSTLLVRPFESERDANAAVQSLQQTGVGVKNAEVETLDFDAVQYHGKGTTVRETMLSGAFGGAFWGTLIGVLAAFGAVQTTSPVSTNAAVTTALLVFFATVLLAALGGGFLGLVIGGSISEDDRYRYQQSIDQSAVLAEVEVDNAQVTEANRLLDRFQNPPKQPVFTEGHSLG